MEPGINFFAVINALGIIQCLLTALALFSVKTGNMSANRFLGIFLIVLAFLIFHFLLIDTNLFMKFPYLYILTGPLIFLLFPPFYFYIRVLVKPDSKLRRIDLWHFAPAALIFALDSPILILSFEELQQAYLKEIEYGNSPIDYFNIVITNGYVLAYLFVCSRKIWNIDKIREQPVSQNVLTNIIWFKRFIIALIFITVLSTIFDFVVTVNPSNDLNSYITPFLITLLVYTMGFMGIRQSEIFTSNRLLVGDKKYMKSSLTPESADDLLNKLQKLMEEEKLFQDSSISLGSLARKMKISTHLLSQLLNERLERNFFNFVGEYRINEARKRLVEPDAQKFTILEIAYEVGFNSLSAFNTAFKKQTGQSPSEFRKQNS